jgi:hypothetical protein
VDISDPGRSVGKDSAHLVPGCCALLSGSILTNVLSFCHGFHRCDSFHLHTQIPVWRNVCNTDLITAHIRSHLVSCLRASEYQSPGTLHWSHSN